MAAVAAFAASAVCPLPAAIMTAAFARRKNRISGDSERAGVALYQWRKCLSEIAFARQTREYDLPAESFAGALDLLDHSIRVGIAGVLQVADRGCTGHQFASEFKALRRRFD